MGARLHIIHIHVTYVKTIYYTDCGAGRGQCEALVGASDVDRYIYLAGRMYRIFYYIRV